MINARQGAGGSVAGARERRGAVVVGATLALILVAATLALMSGDGPDMAALQVNPHDGDPSPASDLSDASVMWVDGTAFRVLTVSSAEAASALAGEAADLMEQRPFTGLFSPDNPQPSDAAIDASLAGLVEVLRESGYEGGIHIEPGVFVLYEGSAPGFELDITVSVSPVIAGGHEGFARDSAALNLDTNTQWDLPEGQHGLVLLGESTAYGLRSGPDPREWVAVQLDSEFFVVSIFHTGTERVIGPEQMIDSVRGVVTDLRTLGLTVVEAQLLASEFGRTKPRDAATLWTMISTRCPAGAARDLCNRPVLDSTR